MGMLLIFSHIILSFLGPGKSAPLGSPFNSPDLIPRLAANPVTAGYLQDPSYMRILHELKTDSKAVAK